MPSNPFAQEMERRQNPFASELTRRTKGGSQDEIVARALGGTTEGTPSENLGKVRDAVVPYAQSLNKGLLSLAGMPTDIGNMALRAVGLPAMPGGGRDIQEAASRVGITAAPGEEPEGLGHRAAEIAGASALPVAGTLARGYQVASRGAQAVQNAGPFSKAAVMASERPGAALAFEGASIGGAAAGGEIAEAMYPDSDIAEVIGELAGGFTPMAAMSGPTVSLARKAGRGVTSALFPFTETGGRIRAARHLQRNAEDPATALRGLSSDDVLPEVPITPARRTGDPRMVAMEESVAGDAPDFAKATREQLEGSQRQAQSAARGIGGDSAATRQALEDRRRAVVASVEARAQKAAEDVQEAIRRMDPDATRPEIARAARQKVEAQLEAAEQAEDQLWRQVDSSAPAGMDRARQTFEELTQGRSKFADPDEIPAFLRRAMDKVTGDETVGDLQTLRSRILKEIRNERADVTREPDRRKIAALTDMQESLLEDMQAVERVSEPIATALAHSRKLNETFRKGQVGKLLGYERKGALHVAPEDTVKRILSGEARGTNVREFLNAAPEAADDLRKYLRASFLMQVGDEPTSKAARQFFRKYDEVLQQFPDLSRELRNASLMGDYAKRMGLRSDKTKRLAYNARKARASLYLDGQIGDEWKRVMRSDNPARMARSLRNRVSGDKKAAEGLKSGLVEYLLDASKQGISEAGEEIVSGARLANLLKKHRNVLSSVGMSPAEQQRIQRAANTLRKLQTKPQPQGPSYKVEDEPAFFLQLAGRLIGAKGGQRLAGGGFGSSLVMAQAGSANVLNKIRALTKDKATELVAQAMADKELFEALMTGPTARQAQQRKAAQTINAWLASPAAEQAQQQNE